MERWPLALTIVFALLALIISPQREPIKSHQPFPEDRQAILEVQQSFEKKSEEVTDVCLSFATIEKGHPTAFIVDHFLNILPEYYPRNPRVVITGYHNGDKLKKAVRQIVRILNRYGIKTIPGKAYSDVQQEILVTKTRSFKEWKESWQRIFDVYPSYFYFVEVENLITVPRF